MFVRFAVVCLSALLLAAPAAAQESSPFEITGIDVAAIQLPATQPSSLIQARPWEPDTTRRPAALMPLYLSFAALQGMDIHSTTRALNRGAVEANPVMKEVVGNQGAFIAVKAAGTVGILYAVEKLRKKNRTAAIVTMVALNAGMAYVVQHNYRVVK